MPTILDLVTKFVFSFDREFMSIDLMIPSRRREERRRDAPSDRSQRIADGNPLFHRDHFRLERAQRSLAT
jgi:hypothetical protein